MMKRKNIQHIKLENQNQKIENPENDNFETLRFGNLNSNDWYVFTGFTVTYTFGNKPCYCRE